MAEPMQLQPVQLDPTTVGIVEIGRDDDGGITAQYYEFRFFVPVPRRQVAVILRDLADVMENTAGELESLEH